MQAASPDSRLNWRPKPGWGAETVKVERARRVDEREKENAHSPRLNRKLKSPPPVQLYKTDELQQCQEAPVEDPQSLARLAQLQATVQPEGSEAFEAFSRDLCGRYRFAWRGARGALGQHIDGYKGADPSVPQAHPGEPSDAEICCNFARLQPSQSQACKWYAQALQADPHCVTALIALADDHRRAERFGEAARLYQAAAAQQRQLPVRSLCRLGEALVRSGRGADGRTHLRRVLQERDGPGSYQVLAAASMALSYAMDQRHERTLQYCRRAEELSAHLGASGRQSVSRELQLVLALRGLTYLRTGDVDAAVEALQAACDESSAASVRDRRILGSEQGERSSGRWDELAQNMLGYAETLRGNFWEAERHLSSTLGRAEVQSPGVDALLAAAFLRHSQGEAEAALELLQRALQADGNSPIALMRMGYFLLCQNRLDEAVHFLQKCLLQPCGTLAYGAAEKGAAQLYLCLALHERWLQGRRLAGSPRSPRARGDSDRAAQDLFRSAYELQPDLRKALMALQGTRFESNEAAAALLVSGSPSRMGLTDLTQQQALTVLYYAEECGAVRLTWRRRGGGRPSPAPAPSASSPSKPKPTAPPCKEAVVAPGLVAYPLGLAAAKPQPVAGGSCCGGSLTSTLATTAPVAPHGSCCGGSLASTLATTAASAASPRSSCRGPLASTLAAAAPVFAHGSCCGGSLASTRATTASTDPVGTCFGGSLGSTLAATASTATPTSVSSSRNATEFALFPEMLATEAAEAVPEELMAVLQDVSDRLPQAKVLPWSDVCLERCMSRGEFAIVNRGRLQHSQTEVVVKMMHHKDCVYNVQAAQDLLAEIGILSELRHARIVDFVGACLEPTHIALVTELAPGGNLHHALHVRRHPFSQAERFRLAAELLDGVRYLHSQRPVVAHLDLKSTNLVLDAECQHLQICDFGLARVIRDEASREPQDSPPSQGGSARYMAPECYDSKLGPVTEKADVWSSGCILIEIFGSCLPYAECSNVQQIMKSMLVHQCGPSIPSCIEANIRGAIAFTFVFEVRERLQVSQVLVLLQTAASSAESRARLARSP